MSLGSKSTTERPQNIPAGIFSILMAMFIFAICNVAAKYVAVRYSVWQITFSRFFLVLIPAFAMVYFDSRQSSIKDLLTPKRLDLLAGTGILGAFAVFILFKAFQIGELANVTALAYSSILFLTALSVPILKETVGWRRWCAVVVGFTGVILMASPGTSLEMGSLLAILFAFMDAGIMIFLRLSTAHNPVSTTVFYMAVFASLTCLPFLISEFQMPNSFEDISAFLYIGLGGGVGQIFMTRAYNLAPASAVSPMIYTSMLWGGLFGVMFFGETITPHLISGAVVVILCSLYIIYRENIERNKPYLDIT